MSQTSQSFVDQLEAAAIGTNKAVVEIDEEEIAKGKDTSKENYPTAMKHFPMQLDKDEDDGEWITGDPNIPIDWEFKQYNAGGKKGHDRIREFLTENDSGKMVVPYNENRIVLFNSSLFHETDEFEFKQGYENRRINVTFLFGGRNV